MNHYQNVKLQAAMDYAKSIIETNKDCFVAQWIIQNQDKNIHNYALYYSYQGDTIKFWMGLSDDRG